MNLDQALASISNYNGTGDSAVEDGLFAYHTGATMAALQCKEALTTPIQLWEDRIRPVVEAAEKRLGKPIHKGAPFYNNGICSFLLNDFEGAFLRNGFSCPQASTSVDASELASHQP